MHRDIEYCTELIYDILLKIFAEKCSFFVLMTDLTTDTVFQFIPKPQISLLDLHQIGLSYLNRFINLLPNIILGFIIFLIFYLFYRFLRIITARALSKAKLAPSVGDALLTILKYCILSYGLILGLEPIFPRITSLLAGLGILGIVIGFAAKDTLANLIAGLSIIWDKPFEVGDVVTVDGATGKVDRISLRSTRLITAENYLVSMPNQNIINNKVINLTRLKKQRIAISLNIDLQTNIDQLRAKIMQYIAEYQQENRILADPNPQLVIIDLKSAIPGPVPILASAQLELWVWIDTTNPNAITPFILREKILEILKNREMND
jgi:small conductance mechanosensitive channel